MRRFVTIAAALALLCAPAAAHAAFPGANGKIAYLTSNGHLFTINPDGSGSAEVPLPSNDGCVGRQGVSWTSDGSLLAIGDCSRMAILAPDGSGFRTVGSGLRMGSWAPDSSRLVYGNNPVCFCYVSIRRVNADGSGDVALINTDGNFNAEWSPDGSSIAYSTSQGIYTMTPDGLAQTKIPFTGHGDTPESWSPDGRQLAFTRPEVGGFNDIYITNQDGSGQKQLTSDGHSGAPSWSPDGTKIVFSRASDLYVMNSDGSSQTRITTNADAYDNDWQPIPFTGYPRPRGASPMRFSLVPAFARCSSPNSTHGAPLAHPSCRPPAQASNFLTVGTPDANGAGAGSVGVIRLRVKTTSPEDVLISGTISDVRCRPGTSSAVCSGANSADGADYSGELQGNATIRITDHFNGPDKNEPATVIDIPFPINFTCSNSSDQTTGGVCTVNTGGAVVCPECGVQEGQRTIVQITQMQVFDGGPDGRIATADNTLFMVQGLFIP
jgi:TolB protein